jgi:hypothetical protein
MDYLSENGTNLAAFLIVAAIFLLVAFVIARKLFLIFKIRITPITPTEAFREHDPQTQPRESGRLRLTSLGRVAVIFVVVLGTITTGVTYVTFNRFEVDGRFAKEGKEITAPVLSASEAHRKYIVQYEFRVDGQTYGGTANIPTLRSLTNARKSGELEVRYLPSDPTINRPAEEKNLPILIGLLPLAPLIVLVVLPVRQLRRDFLLAKIGQLTTGLVVGVVSGSKASTWVYYDFLSERGGVTRGKSWLPVPYSLKVILGSSVQVLYLPSSPERNALKPSMCWQG